MHVKNYTKIFSVLKEGRLKCSKILEDMSNWTDRGFLVGQKVQVFRLIGNKHEKSSTRNFRLQGGAYKDGPENIFLHKWTGQKILDEPDKKDKKDKSGRATHISGLSLYASLY